MWIQLILPMEMPMAKKAKKQRVVRAKRNAKPCIQLEIEFTLKALIKHTPSLVKRAWNWIKKTIRGLMG